MTGRELLLGEWACLGVLAAGPAHGFAVAARLKPDGDVGRVWSLSRALTYRALDQLTALGSVEVVGHEPGTAGGTRTILAATQEGRTVLGHWLDSPVAHLRDLRSELLLKLVLAGIVGVDVRSMLTRQRAQIQQMATMLADRVGADGPVDVVALWRSESAQAGLRFLDELARRS